MNKTIIIVSLVFLVSMVYIGLYGKKYARTFRGFINMDKRGSTLLLAGACIGSNIGNGFVVGGAGKGSVIGLAGSAFGLACACTALVAAVFMTDFI